MSPHAMNSISYCSANWIHLYFKVAFFVLMRAPQVKVPSREAPVILQVCAVEVPSSEEKLRRYSLPQRRVNIPANALRCVHILSLQEPRGVHMGSLQGTQIRSSKSHLSLSSLVPSCLKWADIMPASFQLIIKQEAKHNQQNKGRIMSTWRKLILDTCKMASGKWKNQEKAAVCETLRQRQQ